MATRCAATNKHGHPCGNYAYGHAEYCGKHEEASGSRRAPSAARRTSSPPTRRRGSPTSSSSAGGAHPRQQLPTPSRDRRGSPSSSSSWSSSSPEPVRSWLAPVVSQLSAFFVSGHGGATCLYLPEGLYGVCGAAAVPGTTLCERHAPAPNRRPNHPAAGTRLVTAAMRRRPRDHHGGLWPKTPPVDHGDVAESSRPARRGFCDDSHREAQPGVGPELGQEQVALKQPSAEEKQQEKPKRKKQPKSKKPKKKTSGVRSLPSSRGSTKKTMGAAAPRLPGARSSAGADEMLRSGVVAGGASEERGDFGRRAGIDHGPTTSGASQPRQRLVTFLLPNDYATATPKPDLERANGELLAQLHDGRLR